jgi:hypothetical protein
MTPPAALKNNGSIECQFGFYDSTNCLQELPVSRVLQAVLQRLPAEPSAYAFQRRR